MPNFLTGIFKCESSGDIRLYRWFDNAISESAVPLSGLAEIESHSGAPVALLRHAYGVASGGAEDYSNSTFESYSSEDREQQIADARLPNGNLRDLSYQGFKSAPLAHSYVHAVGPIHAGVIEPGHFRFSLQGEHIRNLRIRLGFQRRGLLKKLVGTDALKAFPLIETVSGDTSVGYSMALSEVYEHAWNLEPSFETAWWKRLLLEVERIAIHVGDLGAIAGDIGFYPLQGVGAADRGVPLGVMESLTGSRFGRSAIWPGTVRLREGLTQADLLKLAERIEEVTARVLKEFNRACSAPSVPERLQGRGRITRADVRRNGFVGMPARCTGLECDLRLTDSVLATLPVTLNLKLNCEDLEGDAWARFHLRAQELERSAAWIAASLRKIKLPSTSKLRVEDMRKERSVKPGVYFSAVEAWRGPLLVACDFGANGLIRQAYVRDPSVLNWHALELAVKGELIGDFPLNNKSFNLSYVGVDL